jgi:uncharacterized Zn-binding protein involved in type VI secretion
VSPTKSAPEAQADPLRKLAELVKKVPRVSELPDLNEKLEEGLALATSRLALALPSFPAATLGALALGLPHAHPTHPPFIPLPPLGPLILGASVNVLIGGLPAMRSGALGLSPTCCGMTPFYVVQTGSSKVFIGGERAVRMSDLTMHCQPPPAAAAPAAPPVSAAPPAPAGGQAGRVLGAAAGAVETAAQSSPDLVTNLASQAAQKLQDELEAAMEQAMGKDPAVPASGTPGMLLLGVPNVLIGGIPTPGCSVDISGLVRILPGKLLRRLTGYGRFLSGAG